MRVDRQGDLIAGAVREVTPGGASVAGFISDIRQNPANCALLERLPVLDLPDAWLVAGCLFQTVWNLRCGRPAQAGIKDYDVFYFDGSDLSAEAEAAVDVRVQALFSDLSIPIEVKNQARVHTWYPEYFGFNYNALHSTRDGIARFLVPCTCVGLRIGDGASTAALYAPYGLDELYGGILRPNPLIDHRSLFRQKAQSYRARWNWLQIVED